MRARSLVLVLLAGLVSQGCYWKKSSGPRGTNLDLLDRTPDHPPGQPPGSPS
ncbi:MAG: hypothetical protein M3680_21680 [Myxococcota bacterium]|nr:hypothetical protein [Myxococcota bacterium]